MIQRKKSDVDILLDVLKGVVQARPDSKFTDSLYQQYNERGWLSKKQIEGLLSLAKKTEAIPGAKLATLEAIILKMPNREKSENPVPTPLYEKDAEVGAIITNILAKAPNHRAVLFIKAKFDNDEVLSTSEINNLKKIEKLLYQ